MISIKDCQQDDASYNAYYQEPKTCYMQTIRLVLIVLCLVISSAVAKGANEVAVGSYAKGKIALDHGDYNKALKEMLGYIHQEEGKANDQKDYQSLMHAYMSTGSIYNLFSDFDAALLYYDKCIKLANRQNDETTLFKVYTNIIGIYCDMQKTRKAEWLNERIRCLKGMNGGMREAYYLFNKGYIARSRHKDELMLKYMMQGIDTLNKYKINGQGKAYAYENISKMYERKGNLTEALKYLNYYYSEAQRLRQQSLIIDCYKAYMQLYTKLGDKDKALYYQDRYFHYSDSLLNIVDFNQVRDNNQAYEQRILNLKMLNLEQTNRYQRYAMIGGVLILALVGLTVYIYRRQQSHINKANDDLFKRNEELLKILNTESAENEKTAKRGQDGKHAELLSKIESVMRNEEVFCDADFSLGFLAAQIGSNTAYVSEAINNYYHKNFRTFINEYRVRVAMQRMGRPQYAGYSIQGLAESVGFKSASNFVLAFKKVTGMPPSLYMKYAKKRLKDA